MRGAAAMTACTGHYAVLHTQEVTGSSPAVSTTKKPWNHNGSEVFSLPFPGRKEPLRLRYFGVFSGNFGASCCKSVANFSSPLSAVPQGFAGFCGYHCCKFLKPTPSEMLHALSRWFVFPCFDDHNACKHARSYPQYGGRQDTAPL